MFVYNKLRGRVIEKYGSMEAFAETLGISRVSLSKKFNNKSGISREEILEWSALLDIPKGDIGAYFFVEEV